MKEKLIISALIGVFAFTNILIGEAISRADKQCHITITDMQGVRHQIKGVADN